MSEEVVLSDAMEIELDTGVGKEKDEPGFFYPLYFPFKQSGWVSKTWWLPLVDCIPIFNLIIMRGWRAEIVRRMFNHKDQILPEVNDIVRFLKDGVILWTMTFLYSILPLFVIAGFGLGGISEFVRDLSTLFSILTGASSTSLSVFLMTEFKETLIAMAIDWFWLLASLPLYRAAMIRYCATGKISSFFNIPANIAFVLQNATTFIKIYLFGFMMAGLVAILSAILLSTLVGAILIPLFALPLYYWSTAYEYGHIAHNLKIKGALSAKL